MCWAATQDPRAFGGDHLERLAHIGRQSLPVGAMPHGGLDVLGDEGNLAERPILGSTLPQNLVNFHAQPTPFQTPIQLVSKRTARSVLFVSPLKGGVRYGTLTRPAPVEIRIKIRHNHFPLYFNDFYRIFLKSTRRYAAISGHFCPSSSRPPHLGKLRQIRPHFAPRFRPRSAPRSACR
jgi:hypothetical protein